MAPKRKRVVTVVCERRNESSFSDCPACQMKVVSYFINHHLDWDCPALIRSKEQFPTALAAKVTNNSIEERCREPYYDSLEFQARPQGSLFGLDAEAERHCSPAQDSVMSLHDRLHCKRAGTELGVYYDGDKLDARVDEGLNITYSEKDSREIGRGPTVGERFHLDWKDNKVHASEQCVELHNGSPKPISPQDRHDIESDVSKQCLEIHDGFPKSTDRFNSHPQLSFVGSPGRCHSSSAASTSNSRGAKGDGWRLITTSVPPKAPKGHYVFENFISEKTGKAYGLNTDLGKRCARPVIFEMPKVLMPIMERMRTTIPVLKDFWPNGTNAIDYCKNKGHWLKAHVDDRQLSGTVVVNVSLCGDCKMTYERERGPRESYKVLLRRRCIQVLTGESRYNFTHSIHNDDLLDPRRVSMTFRQSLSA
ncbi:hypothetical protein L7F22_014719 [Adiantum nelumboides]|nr:hypothetical protein [Adiantum nelumboides]